MSKPLNAFYRHFSSASAGARSNQDRKREKDRESFAGATFRHRGGNLQF